VNLQNWLLHYLWGQNSTP